MFGSTAPTPAVGGGYADRALAEIALRWIQARAEYRGLFIVPEIEPEQPLDPTGKLPDSLATIPGRILQATHLGDCPRTIEPGARIRASVEQRRQHTD